MDERMHFEIYFETFSVDNTNQICYLEQKYILSNDFSERMQVLLDSKNALNSAKTLKGMGYAITFVEKVLGTPNEYKILQQSR